MEILKSLFEGREGEVFVVQNMDEPLSLALEEVRNHDELIQRRARELGIREPFNLLFRGPGKPYLKQQMYTLLHAELGEVDLFLVPVSQDAQGFYYEAVFG